jgi:hypothetical protein
MRKGMIPIAFLVFALGAVARVAAQEGGAASASDPSLPPPAAENPASSRTTISPEVPPEREVFAFALEPGARQATSVFRTIGIAGGMALAGWGISTILDGVTDGAAPNLVHRGIALSAAGSLVVSLFAAFIEAEAR